MRARPIDNPPNPWASVHAEWLEPPPEAELKVYHEQVRSIVSVNRSPDVGFNHSLNPYRGCAHACAYCYARPSHQYWDFGAGTDFERRIVVKVNAAEKLRETFDRRGWAGDTLVFSGNTDCYQPLEAAYGLTRACLDVCLAYRNPVTIITKGALVRRDIDLLRALHDAARVRVFVSVPFLEPGLSRLIEPGASAPRARLATIRALAETGIPVGVAVAPIIPALNDDQIPGILSAAAEAGADAAFRVMLRLPAEVEPVFVSRLREAVPQRADRVLNAIRDVRGGALNSAAFGDRMRGEGQRWEAIRRLFDVHARRLGLRTAEAADVETAASGAPSPFRRPTAQQRLDL